MQFTCVSMGLTFGVVRPQLRENSPRNIGDWNPLCSLFSIYPEVYFYQTRSGSDIPITIRPTIFIRVHSVHAVGRIWLGARKLPPPPYIPAVKLTRIAWFSAISPSILNRFPWNFAKAIFYSNPSSSSPENFTKFFKTSRNFQDSHDMDGKQCV